MSNIMKQLRDLHEYIGEFMRDTDTYLAVCIEPRFIGLLLHCWTCEEPLLYIPISYDDNLEVNEIGDKIFKAYSDKYGCNKNCNWCAHMTSEGCELGKGDTNDDTNKI